MPLDLLVPDLLLPADAPPAMSGLRLPWVERWVARGETQRLPLKGPDAWLARAFMLPDPPPVAPVTLAADAGAREGAWLRADPVHMRIGQDAVALQDASILAITPAEAQALSAALAAHFAADGLELVAPHPERWYLRVPEAEMPATTPLGEAIGRNVFGLLPRGKGRINWGSLITEAQMVMSNHEVNVAREARGAPSINSVWFWGGGALPAKVDSSYALVYASGPFARGLGSLAGVRTLDPVAGFDAIDAVRAREFVLLVDDRLTRALRSGDADAWMKAAQAIDEGWFARIGRHTDRFDGLRVVLPGPRDTVVASISSRSRWLWFRARKPLADHA
jgi:hypothetical protein